MSSTRLLHRIDHPDELRCLTLDELSRVAADLRDEIVETVSRTGGHLASSLGAIELITGLHYVFDTPRDRLVLDVGHQGYAHKMLTARRARFPDIGKAGGIGKFLRRSESEFDHFGAGHAGTSISAALGIARALEDKPGEHCAIALIGDASIAAGMAFEALNHAGDLHQRNLVVVLNDNQMSMSPTVGALSSYLTRKLSGPAARRMRTWAKEFLASMHEDVRRWAGRAEDSLKALFLPSILFESLGFKYVGPIQGNRLPDVVEALRNVRRMVADGEGPLLVHAITAKGFGYAPAERDPDRYHGVTPFEIASGCMHPAKPSPPTYTRVFGDTLVRLARRDPRVVGITAAMSGGTGLEALARAMPERFHDVGIAEQHAVTFAAGLATEGAKPVVAIYSTFLQRCYDQIVHDVCVQNLDVTFALDRAGLVGADGATHQGIYDLSFLRPLPNLVVMAPKDENELQHMLLTAIDHPGPAALRYPRGSGRGVALDAEIEALPIGEAELLRAGDDVLLVTLGTLAHAALEAADALAAHGLSAAVLNARFAKPLDETRIARLARRCGAVVTAEEHSGVGGFGAAVLEALMRAGVGVPIRCLALPDRLIEHGNADAMLAECGLDALGIERAALELHARGRRAPLPVASAGEAARPRAW
jgi:1-deoxy-D-xylulose-5-phosphate synthase